MLIIHLDSKAKMFRKIKRYLNNPYWEFGNFFIKHCPKVMSDKYYLSVLYYKWYGKKIDWDNPRTFNEKLQWLKLYDRNPLYPTLVDKYEAKKWVADKIGEHYVVPTLGVWNHFDEIDFDKLPNQFVLKCTHDSGSVVICNDKASFDKDAAKVKLESALKKNFYWWAREWPYKKLKHRIIAEPLLANQKELIEFKYFCFEGKPMIFQTCTDRDNSLGGAILNFYNCNSCEKLDVVDAFHERKSNDCIDLKGENAMMLDLCNMVLKHISSINFLRIDFFCVNSIVYVGELTLYENGGMCLFKPEKWNLILGDWIKLRKK